MDPASDRSYHPGSVVHESAFRSAFHGGASPAAQRQRSRSRGRGGFSEVKSPSVAPSKSDSRLHGGGNDASYRSRMTGVADGGGRSQAGYRDGGRGTNDNQNSNQQYNTSANSNTNSYNSSKKSLDQHFSTKPKEAYELDIQSHDKDQPTWASRDWNAEARRTKQFLRDAAVPAPV